MGRDGGTRVAGNGGAAGGAEPARHGERRKAVAGAGGPAASRRDGRRAAGMALGLLAVLLFSVTLPATRYAVAYLDPALIGPGRGAGAALAAAFFLSLSPPRSGRRWPGREDVPGLLAVAAGTVVGFPLLSALALRDLPATHGAVLVGLLPLATAGMATWRAGERPSPPFWLAALAGTGLVVAFAFHLGAGSARPAAGVLLAAVLAAALGHAEGGRLARHLGGLAAIGWASLLSLPVTAWPVIRALRDGVPAAPPAAWLALAYVSLVSQFAAFGLWYRGMATGGVARVSQVQLLQPFFTILLSTLLPGEPVTASTIATALLVLAVVVAGRRAPVEAAAGVVEERSPAAPRQPGHGSPNE